MTGSLQMADETDIAEPDRVEGAPHPRETIFLMGQNEAEQEFLSAWQQGRMHHAWLITGPRGTGKATLAYRIARFLIGLPEAATSLDLSPEARVFRAIAHQAEPRLLVCRRPWDDKEKRLKTVITIEEVRRLKSFFALSATDAGSRRHRRRHRRDEPGCRQRPAQDPRGTTGALGPAAGLPQAGHLAGDNPLAMPRDQAQAADAGQTRRRARLRRFPARRRSDRPGGTVRRLGRRGGAHPRRGRTSALRPDHGADRFGTADEPSLIGALGDQCAGAANAPRYDMVVRLILLAIARLARAGAGSPAPAEASKGEAAIAARLSPGPAQARVWADLEQALAAVSPMRGP